MLFFFQAEDGIRDTSVTGVQTCALPIWSDLKLRVLAAMLLLLLAKLATIAVPFTFKWATDALAGQGAEGASDWLVWRSEERRVGKEGGARGWRGWWRQSGAGGVM